MKKDLEALRNAGVRRARFTARVDARNERGAIGLHGVRSPTGITHHTWISPGEWHGPLPRKWDTVEFTATIREYYKGNGILDIGLFDVRVLR